MENEKKMKLSSPWVTLYREIEALFAKDEEVKVVFDENELEIKLYVERASKAEALTKLLPVERTFGNVTVLITVVPANAEDDDPVTLFDEAFTGNPVLKEIVSVASPVGSFDYVVFQREVVQFFNDELSDPNGNKSTLYEDIARDVFGLNAGTFFCTDGAEGLTKPLGEWP